MTNQPDDTYHILEKKIKACGDFLSATLLLKEALEIEEMTAINHLIGRCQELIKDIDDMDRRIGHYRQAGPPDKDQRIVILSEDLKRVLKQIMSANHDCDAIAAGRCEGLKNEMIAINRKGEGLQGYVRGTKRMPKFLNLRT